LYSLGCVLYEMLVGETPFTGANAAVMLARHTQQAVPSVRLVRPDVPDALETVVRTALAKAPEERFSTGQDFADALHSAVTQPTLTVPPVGTSATPAQRMRGRRLLAALGAAIVFIAAGYFALGLFRGDGNADDRVRLVVLPFQNLSSPEREYFADGLSEEITTRLAGISGLAVIARTSAMQYKGGSKPTSQIVRELNVAYLIEGSVRCTCVADTPPTANDRLLVNARLINAADETQVWGFEYNRLIGEVFDVQSDIAQVVASKLNVALAEPEKKRLAIAPTKNLDAYDFYLRGNSYYNRSWARTDVQTALDMYKRAVELDPKFALGFAQLARTSAWLHRLAYDTTAAVLASARSAAEKALALDPDLPEAHVAMGLYHYWGRWDYPAAAAELAIARRLQPGNALVHQNIGNVRRREGKWDEAIAAYREAANLDPRSHQIWFNLGETYAYVRDFKSAESELQRISVLAPDFLEGYLERALIMVKSRGDVAGAMQTLQQSVQRVSPSQWRLMPGFWLLGYGSVLVEKIQPAVKIEPGVFGLDSATYYIVQARQFARAGQSQRAIAASDSARALLERVQGPHSARQWSDAALALAYAGMGRKEDALRAAQRAAALLATDKFDGPDMVAMLGMVHLMLGDVEQGMKNVEIALSMPSRLSFRVLDLNPIWAPLRSHPRYAQLNRMEERSVVDVVEAGAQH
jgi:TolB-like protein/Flp pilus assembly protein TadD